MSHDVDTEASNGTANGCPTISVRSQKQTAILESGQQQGVQTAVSDPTEKFDLVSTKEDKDCGPEEEVRTCEVFKHIL
jgi:type II secretory pathway component PulK